MPHSIQLQDWDCELDLQLLFGTIKETFQLSLLVLSCLSLNEHFYCNELVASKFSGCGNLDFHVVFSNIIQ